MDDACMRTPSANEKIRKGERGGTFRTRNNPLAQDQLGIWIRLDGKTGTRGEQGPRVAPQDRRTRAQKTRNRKQGRKMRDMETAQMHRRTEIGGKMRSQIRSKRKEKEKEK